MQNVAVVILRLSYPFSSFVLLVSLGRELDHGISNQLPRGKIQQRKGEKKIARSSS